MITSVLSEMEDGLLALLAARPALDGVKQQAGDPGADLRTEHIFTIELATADQSWADSSGAEKSEELSLTVVVYVARKGAAYTDLRDRAQALAGEIEQAIADDPTLSGSVWDASVTRVERDGGIAGDNVRVAVLSLTVSATAFLV